MEPLKLWLERTVFFFATKATGFIFLWEEGEAVYFGGETSIQEEQGNVPEGFLLEGAHY